MGDKPDIATVVVGSVASIQLSGFGPNSGELTLTLKAGNETVQVFAGIIDAGRHPNGIEHGVFAGYISIASLAMTANRQVRCSYLERDKLRINGLAFA